MKHIKNNLDILFSRKQKAHLFLLLFIILGGAIAELLGVSMVLPFAELLIDGEKLQNNNLFINVMKLLQISNTDGLIAFLGISLIIVYVLKNVYLIFMYYYQYKFIYYNQKTLAAKLMKRYMNMPYLFHTTENSAVLVRTINEDVNRCFLVVLNSLQIITEVCVVLTLGMYLLYTDVLMTLSILILVGGCAIIFVKIFRKKTQKYGKDYQYASGKMIQWLNQGFGGIKEIKVSEKTDFFVDKYEENYLKYATAQLKFQVLGQMPKGILETLTIGVVMLVVIIKVLSGVDMRETLPQLSVFIIAAYRILPSANRINNSLNTIMFNMPSMNKICNDLIYTQDKIERNEPKSYCGGDVIYFKQDITIQSLSFRYPGKEKYVFRNVFMKIYRGESVAIVGPSGAGKTTFVDLILGLLNPEQGVILVDGIDILENKKAWANLVGYIPQTIYLSDDTVRNNIAFGYKEIDDKKVWKALKQAQLDKFIQGLDKGLDTIVGERGVQLSGGQRQRIGIARALYHDPDILILDEATSALDTNTELAVMEAIEKFKGEKTMIIIAHRLSTIQNCDRVYEVRDSEIFEKKL
jgi:ABC-type multidrug transport system fused ATPase/permease subunit